MEFLKPRLSKRETEAARQAFSNGIEFFFTSCEDCKKPVPCVLHQGPVSLLRSLIDRFKWVQV